jgi:hypothetical protein
MNFFLLSFISFHLLLLLLLHHHHHADEQHAHTHTQTCSGMKWIKKKKNTAHLRMCVRNICCRRCSNKRTACKMNNFHRHHVNAVLAPAADENVERVLVNDVAEIKCDVSSNIESDQVLLVVWYKNNLPIYR